MSLRQSIQALWVVSGSTAGSRVLGLIRDILTAASLGISAISSAFLYAFTLPNLFRRLLGEGALTSTLIPSLSKARAEGGDSSVFRLMNGVLSWLVLVLVLLSLLGCLIFYCLPFWFPDIERVKLVSEYGLILFPYLILVCLAAAFAAFLQVFQRFALAALSPVWLNLSMILCLLVVLWRVPDIEERAWWLCWAVLLGGVIQVWLPMRQSWQIGWRPQWCLWGGRELLDVWKLFLPGVLGASVFQVNILVSRTLALQVDAGGVSYLYLANRLMELPLGLIAIAVTTVAFPLMSRSFSEGRNEGGVSQYGESVRLVLALMIPSAAGLVLLAEPILRILFLYGGVTAVELSQATPVLQVFALGLPFYSLATLSTRVFHARRDTRTPVKIAIVAFLVNLTGSLLLMNPLGVVGLAWANLISIVIQCLLLEILWRRQIGPVRGVHWEWHLGKPVLSTLLMAGVVLAVVIGWEQWGSVEEQTRHWGKVLVGIPLGAAVYLGALLLLRAPEGGEVLFLWQRYVPVAQIQTIGLRIVGAIQRNRLMAGMILLFVVAFLFPEPGSKQGVLRPEYTTQIGLVLIFLIQGLCVHWRDWMRGLLDWRLHLFTQSYMFLVFPAVIMLLLWPLRTSMNEFIWLGLAYTSLLPTTVATAVVYTTKSMGDSASALFNCLLSNILGVFLVPLGVAFVLGLDSEGFPYMDTLLRLFMLVVVPALVGQAFSWLLTEWVGRHRAMLRSGTEVAVLFTAYCAFSESVVQRSWEGLAWSDILLGAASILAILIVVRVLMWYWLQRTRFSVVQRKAAYFCGVQKTIALGIPMGYYIFSDYSGVGLILFPLIIYHFSQLLLDGAIAYRWANQETA